MTGTLDLDGSGGGVSTDGFLEVYLDGELVGTGNKQGGFHLPFESTPGKHTLKIKGVSGGLLGAASGFLKKLSGQAERLFPVEFPEPGVYAVTFGYSGWAKLSSIGSKDAAQVPTTCDVRQQKKKSRRQA